MFYTSTQDVLIRLESDMLDGQLDYPTVRDQISPPRLVEMVLVGLLPNVDSDGGLGV